MRRHFRATVSASGQCSSILGDHHSSILHRIDSSLPTRDRRQQHIGLSQVTADQPGGSAAVSLRLMLAENLYTSPITVMMTLHCDGLVVICFSGYGSHYTEVNCSRGVTAMMAQSISDLSLVLPRLSSGLIILLGFQNSSIERFMEIRQLPTPNNGRF